MLHFWSNSIGDSLLCPPDAKSEYFGVLRGKSAKMQRCGNNLHKRGNHTTKDNELLLISQIWKGFWSVILVLTFKITKLTAGAVKERT